MKLLKVVMCSLAMFVSSADRTAEAGEEIPVHLEIVADSSNHIVAQIEVESGTNGRDLMERLFKMDYMDATRRFVIGIAGFKAVPKQKQFWKLEIDGKASDLGIAEIVIKQATRMRWTIVEM